MTHSPWTKVDNCLICPGNTRLNFELENSILRKSLIRTLIWTFTNLQLGACGDFVRIYKIISKPIKSWITTFFYNSIYDFRLAFKSTDWPHSTRVSFQNPTVKPATPKKERCSIRKYATKSRGFKWPSRMSSIIWGSHEHAINWIIQYLRQFWEV